jgi:hypothetical protein
VENAGFGAGNAAPIARKVIDAYLLGEDGKVKPTFSSPSIPAQPAEPSLPESKVPEPVPQKQAQLGSATHPAG